MLRLKDKEQLDEEMRLEDRASYAAHREEVQDGSRVEIMRELANAIEEGFPDDGPATRERFKNLRRNLAVLAHRWSESKVRPAAAFLAYVRGLVQADVHY